MAAAQPKLKDYVFTTKVGSGSYATVFKAFKVSSTERKVVAVKCIKKSSLNKASVENLMKEIEILKQIQHENVVQLFDFQWDASYIYLIMEYCGGGDLSQFIRSKRTVPEFVVRRFLQQIATAMQMLYENKIAHFDLKPHNILLTSSQQPVLKLADFGFAQYRAEVADTREHSNTFRGSPLYMAPEIILGKPYDAKVDLWSLGVILFEALFGRAPYASSSIDSLLKKFLDDKPVEIPINPPISPECRNLLGGLLQRDPAKRISFEELFQHEFVDLEHRPSSSCLSKAISLVSEAVRADSEGRMEEACKLYSNAIQYFVPAIYHASDPDMKKQIRIKVKEYCDRAEQLKMLLSSSNTSIDEINRRKHLLAMTANIPDVNSGLGMLYEACDLESAHKYLEALNLYEEAIQKLLPTAPKQSKLLQKLLHSELEKFLNRVELLKAFIKVQESNSDVVKPHSTPQATSTSDAIDSNSLTGRCTIQ